MDKRKKRGRPSKAFSSPPQDKMVKEPEVKKVIRYPRICPYCDREGYSTICKCGRLTKLNLE